MLTLNYRYTTTCWSPLTKSRNNNDINGAAYKVPIIELGNSMHPYPQAVVL